ncbi:MAG: hypothetical protein OQL16_08005 [Gammaproteobacteria bacterium]|nr:hypothetical protein [Gammaproteobacteria bacterium]
MINENKYLGTLGAIWGFAGAFALIGYAVWRLTPLALNALEHSLSSLQWTLLIGNVLFMAYSEGYKGFQQAFAPRVAARSLYLSQNPTPTRLLLAPLFVIGYFHATRRRLVTSYLLTVMIIVLIILVHQLDQPWRGIVDAGVVIGLGWGLISMLYFIIKAVTVSHYPFSPEVS